MRARLLSTIGAVIAAAGCGSSPVCGPGDAPASGLVASGSGVTLTYGGLSGGQNHDCPDPSASGVQSLTITGMQTGGSGYFTICVPRPDKLGGGLPIGPAGGPGVQLVTVSGTSAGCTFDLAPSATPTGTISGRGVCANGASKDGWAMTLTGTATLTRTCGATIDTVAVMLSGTVAVTAQ